MSALIESRDDLHVWMCCVRLILERTFVPSYAISNTIIYSGKQMSKFAWTQSSSVSYLIDQRENYVHASNIPYFSPPGVKWLLGKYFL